MRRVLLFVFVLIFASIGAVGAQTLQPMTSGIVPVVAHLHGDQGSFWTTSVYVTQVSGNTPAKVGLTILNPAGTSWSTLITMPNAKGTLSVDDVVKTVDPGIPDGKYVLTWWATESVVLSTRTFTTGGAGTYGQGVGSVAPGSGFFTNGQVIFPAPMDFAGHRVAVGVANAGQATQSFEIKTLDAGGAEINSWSRDVAAGAVDQFRSNTGMTGAGSIEVKCVAGCDGNAYAYSSVVVNGSSDAYFLYAGAAAGTTSYAPVQTVRDDKGVWTITGGSLYDVFEAMGYAVATDRLWQAELFRRSARGTMAEVFGSDFLSNDIFMRTIGYTEAELKTGFDRLDADSKTVIQAYVDGFNRRIAEVRADPAQLPFEFKAVGGQLGISFVPADWTVTDVLDWVSLMQRNFDPEALNTGQIDNAMLFQALTTTYGQLGQAMFSDLRWINDPAAQTYIPAAEGSAQLRAAALQNVPTLDPSTLPPLRQADRSIRNRLSNIFASLKKVNARVKMGSYAWVVSGQKTASGRPIIYSGPQMGFSVPAIVLEGSILGGGLKVSGMTVAGIPGIIIGRTPHHAWSMQVGHAHTLDYYFEAPQSVHLDRMETVHVAGAADVTIPVFKTGHGPVIEPIPFDPANPPSTIISWDYAQRGFEFGTLGAFLQLARATSMQEFGQGIDEIAVSQHFCYADKDGNIAYWMSGFNPVRPAGVDPRFPLTGDGTQEWPTPVTYLQRPHDENTSQGWYGGWNNKAEVSYNNAPNNLFYNMGPFHRAHVIKEYLDSHDNLTFEQVRDLAINIATTDSVFATLGGSGGNPWEFLKGYFTAAVQADPTPERTAALALLDDFDGHFVAGGPSQWVNGLFRSDAWVLQDAWLREVLRLTFEDEFAKAGLDYSSEQPLGLLLNVLLHQLAGANASLPTLYDWFQDQSGSGKPTTADGIIVQALDNTLANLGPQPWLHARGFIRFKHDILGEVHAIPYASRSTYAHVVEYGPNGPVRIESMFPLGESGTILMDQFGAPQYDPNFFSMAPVFDAFAPRPFPLFQ